MITDKERQTTFPLSELSNGEKSVLALLPALYPDAGVIARPIDRIRPKGGILLLDEYDSGMHPSMVKGLIDVLLEQFIKRYHMMVMMTTHSPTTAALAPESSLSTMVRQSPRLEKVTRDRAVSGLLIGVEPISFRLENQRTILVEGPTDRDVYQRFSTILQTRIRHPDISLIFLPIGISDVGGADRVKQMVSELRSQGNGLIYGIIDSDNAAPSELSGIFINHERHSIENFVLDPLLLGATLLGEEMLTAEELGLPSGSRPFELDPEHAEPLAAAVLAKLGFSMDDQRSVPYVGGFAIDLPRAFLEYHGHDLQDLVLEKLPRL